MTSDATVRTISARREVSEFKHHFDFERHRGIDCPRKGILVVNCYFDDSRLPIPRTNKLPRPMGPAYLAGEFSRELCEVRLHCETYSGPSEDPQLLAWPDNTPSVIESQHESKS